LTTNPGFDNTYRLPDPAGAINILWGPKAAVQRRYKYWKAPKAFNDAANVVLTSGDMAERRKAFGTMLDVIEDDMPMTILYNPLASYGVSKKVEWMPYPIFYMDFRPDILKFK
jgi:peptide/nickel transport system substrate-binding protein